MSIFDELAKELLSVLKKRQRKVVIFFVVCASATFFVMREQILLRQIFAVGVWVIVGSWYLIFSTKLRRLWRIVTIVIVSVGSVGWSAGVFYELTSDIRHTAALMESADTLCEKGLYSQSANKLDKALTIARKSKLRSKEMRCLLKLGQLNYLLGNHDRARKHLTSGQALAIEFESSADQALAILRLAHVERIQGNNDLARQHYGEARGLYQREGSRLGEAHVLSGLGDLECMLGNNDLARQHYGEARGLCQKEGSRLGEAHVLSGLGDLERVLGNNDLARQHYAEARRIYSALGMQKDAKYLKKKLDSLDSQ